MTFFASPPIAPFAAARAAPLRYHHAAVSPRGCVIAGTSMAAMGGGAVSRTVAVQAASVTRKEIDSNGKRMRQPRRKALVAHYAAAPPRPQTTWVEIAHEERGLVRHITPHSSMAAFKRVRFS